MKIGGYMKKLICILVIMFSINMLGGETYVNPGDVYGIWSPNGSPYIIKGNITIPKNNKLVIHPGTIVFFDDFYQLNVHGLLYAIGTESKMITFQSNESKHGWSGILFSKKDEINPVTNSKLIYCRFQYTSNDLEPGVPIRKFTKENSRRDYGAAIELREVDNVQISNCVISWLSPTMWGSGISLYKSSPVITENTIVGNNSYEGAGIYMDGKSHPIICTNRIVRNSSFYGGGVCIRNSKPTIVNNLIENNYASKGGILIVNVLIL